MTANSARVDGQAVFCESGCAFREVLVSQSPHNATAFDALLTSISKAAEFNKDDAVAPAAILWTDEKREWERLVPRVRAVRPEFLALGPYDPATRTGPAIWLRCVLAGKIAAVPLPPGAVPIIYLPGVSRPTLRATEDCPDEVKPLAELQYRGVFWSQLNGKDWTLAAFLQTEKGGLHLNLAKDQNTATALRRAVEKLADVPVADLKAKAAAGELNGGYFDSLVSDDPVDDLLSWMADPKGVRQRWEAGRWETLCSRCAIDYGFDPDKDGELVAAEKLGTQPKGKAAWKTAWKRFAAAPLRYPGLEALLRRAKPKSSGSFLGHIPDESWPQDNEAEEAALRQALLALADAPEAAARAGLLDLEDKHGPRRDWVWARMTRSPLAQAMQHLAVLAKATEARLAGATAADMVSAYTAGGWKADAAVLDALAAVNLPADRDAVGVAVARVYTPWLRDAAELFQKRVKADPLPGRETPRLGDVAAGTCVLFADGLRYDLGKMLADKLGGKVGKLQMAHHFVALPSVTPTAKPAVSPVAAKIGGSAGGEDFRPCVAADGKDLTPDRFRKLLAEDVIQFLASDDTGDPAGRAWTEFGNVDQTGHNEGAGLARRIPELLDSLALRIVSLLTAGWQEVRVVTDHGWLLLPKGLPKANLDKYLTETRWRRCAVVKATATVGLDCFSWFWADDVRVASAPGIDCFMAGEEYNHGGLSLQECVVPQFAIRPGGAATVAARIDSHKWSGLRCRVQAAGDFAGCKVDIRDKVGDPASSIAAPKAVGKDGAAALVVDKDDREGTAAVLVLLDAGGNVIDKTPVTVGG